MSLLRIEITVELLLKWYWTFRLYTPDDMEEYRRWKENIRMDLKEIGVDVMS